MKDTNDGAAGGAGARSESPAIREISSEQLLQGAREVIIRHNDSIYRLRATNQGKLILTK